MSEEKHYIRVTSVLKPFYDFSSIKEEVLQEAAIRGTEVHKNCEAWVNGLDFIPPSDEIAPYVESFKKWFNQVVEKTLATEIRYRCDHYEITGQIDLVLRIKGDHRPIIVDIKTSQAHMSKHWRLQTAAYFYLHNLNSTPVDRRSVLMLDKEGKMAKFHEYGNHERDMNLFFDALKLYKHFQ